MRFNDIEDRREVERAYEYFIRRHGYITFDEFMKYEYRELRDRRNFARTFDFDSINVNTSSEKSNSNDSCEYRGFFDSVSIEPMSELDRQTLNRWTKGESLQEQWNKLR